MASPTSNATATSVYAVPGDNSLASLLDGAKWGSSAVGAGVSLSYSFPSAGSSFSYSYEWSQGSGLTASEQAVVRQALAEWSAVANVTFVEVSDTSSLVGELRFAESTRVDAENSSAWSYMPGSFPAAGDTWLSPSLFGGNANNGAGDWNYLTLVHEIGHSLGLKHPFESGTASTATLPTATDYYHFTVMSYSAAAGNTNTSASIYPTSPMLYDIAAIQYLYGANTGTNAGDSTYTYSSGGRYLETIWDGGGTDTIVYDGTSGGAINLNAGAFSQLGLPVTYGNQTSNPNTVAIAFNCVIENATGGGGNDTITGNAANNSEQGGNGADLLFGNAGNDSVFGGGGNDTQYAGRGEDLLLGNAGNDLLIANDGDDWLYGGVGGDLLLGNAGADRLVGNDDADSLYGGIGNDSQDGGGGADALYGDPGADTLTGGAGGDAFVFTSLDGADLLTDFSAGEDMLWFSRAVFTSLSAGTPPSASLRLGTAALDADDFLVFDGGSGALWYDADGAGAGAAARIATLSGVATLSASSILVI